jgi:hypothetical protein
MRGEVEGRARVARPHPRGIRIVASRRLLTPLSN